jgi:hypothetical protein
MGKKKGNKGKGYPEWMRQNQPNPNKSKEQGKHPETTVEQMKFLNRNGIWLASLAWGAWQETTKKGFVWIRRFVLPDGQLVKAWSAGFIAPDDLFNARPDWDKEHMLAFFKLCDPDKGYVALIEYASESGRSVDMHLVLNNPRPPEAFEELKTYSANVTEIGTLAEAKLPYDRWRMDFKDQVEYVKNRVVRQFKRSRAGHPIDDYIDEMPEPEEHVHQFVNYHLSKIVALAYKGYKEQGKGAVCLWRITDGDGQVFPGDWGMKYIPLKGFFKLFPDLPESGVFAMIQNYKFPNEFVFCVHYNNEQLYWGVNFGLPPGQLEKCLEKNPIETLSPVIYGREVKLFPELHAWVLNLLAEIKI